MSEYSSVSEITGYNVTSEQLQRMYTRYRFASEFCKDKDVLEVACGSGQGLGYIEKLAKSVVGGDCDDKIVECACNYYKDRINIEKMDALALPLNNKSFDVIILYEAIYYLPDPEKFVSEAKRVLRDDGVLIIGSANREWSGFNPSPHSHKYFSATELFSLLEAEGFSTQLFADSLVAEKSFADKVKGLIKVMAVKLHLMPKTMKGKEILKRIFQGKLTPLPAEITDGIAEYTPPVPIPHDKPMPNYKVIFAVAQKRVRDKGKRPTG